MSQQHHFWVYNQKNCKRGLKGICFHSITHSGLNLNAA